MKWPRVKILRVTRREKALGVEDFRALSSKNTRELETIRVRRNKLLERIFSEKTLKFKILRLNDAVIQWYLFSTSKLFKIDLPGSKNYFF